MIVFIFLLLGLPLINGGTSSSGENDMNLIENEMNIIENLYCNYVLSDDPNYYDRNKAFVEEYCSQNLREYLQAQDVSDYNLYNFSALINNLDSDISYSLTHKFKSVTYLGDNWFQVDFYILPECVYESNVYVKFADYGGRMLIDEVSYTRP